MNRLPGALANCAAVSILLDALVCRAHTFRVKRLAPVLCAVLVALSASAAPMGLLVPAYFYPPTYWDGLNFAASRVPLEVIVNPDNGPGASQDPNYVAVVNSLRAAGGKTMGYVHSSYATRSTNAIQSEITNFFSFYTIDGIFVDEMTNDANTNHYNYYAGLFAFIQTKGTNLFVTGNPGTTTQEPYQATVNALLTFEDGAGYSNYVADAWVTNYLARDFCHVIYAVTNAVTMTNYISLAASRNVGWVFVTDDTNTANPYERLPVYWTNEVNYVRSMNLAQPATQLSLMSLSDQVPRLQISGAPGAYEVQASTNLTSWPPIAIVDATTNSVQFKDLLGTNFSGRYYRTRQ